MSEELKPRKGGFLRPFGCGWFIREFLLGNAPYGAPQINPDIGAPQADIHRLYKEALFQAYAEDMVAVEEEKRARMHSAPLSIEEAEKRTSQYLKHIPQRLTRMRYASFTRYFSHLKRLGYVEASGREEPSEIQENYPEAPPRRYYRLTETGKQATPEQMSDPVSTLYGYSRTVRSSKKKQF